MFAEPQDLFGNLDEVCSVKRLTVAGDSSVLILTITFKLNDIYFSTDICSRSTLPRLDTIQSCDISGLDNTLVNLCMVLALVLRQPCVKVLVLV